MLAHHGWSEAAVVRHAVRALPAGGLLMLGNSLPIREVDCFTTADDAPALAGVLSQRGAAGIDGLIAGAAGAASASGRPLTLLIGDVSFLHDIGGLAACAALTTPLAIVVLHNDGGRIFEQLPVARLPDIELAPWTTPHGLALAPAAALYGLTHARVDDDAGLDAALAAAHTRAGATVIEARVPPSGAAALQRDLAARVAAACSREGLQP